MPGAKRKYDYDDILTRLKQGEAPGAVRAATGASKTTLGRVARRYRQEGELPPLVTGVALLDKMGIGVGAIRPTLDERLTHSEWEWLLDRVSRDDTDLAAVFATMIRDAAVKMD